MNELFPCAAGVAAGFALQYLLPARLRVIALFAVSIVVGIIASTISGELELSLGFIPVDIAEAFGLGLLAMAVAMLWERRAARPA